MREMACNAHVYAFNVSKTFGFPLRKLPTTPLLIYPSTASIILSLLKRRMPLQEEFRWRAAVLYIGALFRMRLTSQQVSGVYNRDAQG